VFSAESVVPAVEIGTERMRRVGLLPLPPPRRTTNGGGKSFYDESATHVGYERNDAHLLLEIVLRFSPHEIGQNTLGTHRTFENIILK